MAGDLLPVRLERSGNRLPVPWVPRAPGGLPLSGALAGQRPAWALPEAVLRPGPRWAAGPARLELAPVPVPAPVRRPLRGWLLALARLGRTTVQGILAVVGVVVALTVVGTLTGRWGLVPVLTGSMRPGIEPGDLVLVTPEPFAAVRVGQILDFQPPGEGGATVVHRIVSATRRPTGPVIRTKGDANNVADPWKAQLGGTTAWRVRAVIPKLGYLSVAEHNPNVRLAVEASLFLGGVMTGLGAIWRRTDEESGSERVPAGVAAV